MMPCNNMAELYSIDDDQRKANAKKDLSLRIELQGEVLVSE